MGDTSRESFASDEGHVSAWPNGVLSDWYLGATHAQQERAALRGMSYLCTQLANEHGSKSNTYKSIDKVLEFITIVLGIAATVVASIIPARYTDVLYFQIYAAVITGVSSLVSSIYAILSPASKKQAHASIEHRYRCLARDIAIKLVTRPRGNLTITPEEYWEDVLRDSQRVLDNIQGTDNM